VSPPPARRSPRARATPAESLLATLALVVSWLLVSSLVGCSSRVETPVERDDATLAYASREPAGVEATITFCRKVGRQSGKRFGVGRTFPLAEGAKVRACVDLENPLALGERELMFHLVWLGPGEREFYTKRIDWTPDPDDPILTSSISIPPERREPGEYALKVYLFRELIAEKSFELLPPSDDAA
jgi:hypothetical protein